MLAESLLVILLLVLVMNYTNRKPPNLPPGKWGLPILGSLPRGDVALGDQVLELRKKCGNIVSWRVGGRILIFFCDYKIIKSAFSKMEFSDRPDYYTFNSFNLYTKSGLALANGQKWVRNRRFVLRQLRDLGMGKTRLEEAIQYEANCLVKDFEKRAGKPSPLPWSISGAVFNVLWKMVADRRFEIDDPDIQKFNQVIASAFDDCNGPVIWLDLFPWLIPITPPFVKRWMGVGDILKKAHMIHNFLEKAINEHKKMLDPENTRDFIDSYLAAMEKHKDDPDNTMSEIDLKCCINDLISAGTETTSSTIDWAIHYLAKYPEVQAKVHKEIDSVVPRDTLPSIQHRNDLPYLEAVILEVHRNASFARMGLVHSASQDVEFEGFTIPKGALLFGHIEWSHMDPNYWERPNEFYPEHFLDDKGRVNTKKEGFMPFAVGRRQCPGESLARMELFVFLSALLQNFSFSPPEGEDFILTKDPKEALLNFPKPKDIVITKRL